MIYRYLFILLVLNSCDKITESTIETNRQTKEEIHKEYILNLQDKNIEEVNINQDFVNILSIKHNITDSVCTRIIVDYLNVVNNNSREYSNQYKVETIKNYAFENNLQKEQVANLLHDYINYRDSKKN